MNRYKCPACGGNQYTSTDTAEGCIYCDNKELKKMEILEPEEVQELAKAKADGRLVVLPVKVDNEKLDEILKFCSNNG